MSTCKMMVVSCQCKPMKLGLTFCCAMAMMEKQHLVSIYRCPEKLCCCIHMHITQSQNEVRVRNASAVVE